MPQVFRKILTPPLAAGVLLCAGSLSHAQTPGPPLAALTDLRVDHVTISVENLDREAEWYERVLGFKVTDGSDSNPDFMARQLRIPVYRIDLIKFKGSTRPAPVDPIYLRQGWVHIAFNVPDLQAALAALRAMNTDVTIGTKDAHGVPTRLIVHDPESNEIEFFNRR